MIPWLGVSFRVWVRVRFGLGLWLEFGLGLGLWLGIGLGVCGLLFWAEFQVVRYTSGTLMNEGAKLHHLAAVSVAAVPNKNGGGSQRNFGVCFYRADNASGIELHGCDGHRCHRYSYTCDCER